jgi:hypothetical protein
MAKLLAATETAPHDRPVFQMTLLELVHLLLDITNTEEETMRMALTLVVSGDVRLIGNFRGEGVERWN